MSMSRDAPEFTAGEHASRAPVLRVGGRAVTDVACGEQAQGDQDTASQGEEVLDDSWTTVPVKTKPRQPVEQIAEGEEKTVSHGCRHGPGACGSEHTAASTQGAGKPRKAYRQQGESQAALLQQPGFGSAMQRAPAPRHGSQWQAWHDL